LRKREEDEREKRGRKYRESVRKESIKRIEEKDVVFLLKLGILVF
jgi:hypothetical protein